MHRHVLIRVAVVLAAAAVQARGAEPPVAPSPETGLSDRGVIPATHRTGDTDSPAEATGPAEASRAAEPRGAAVPLGPVPLSATTAAGSRGPAAPPRPLPDWRLLAALGGAFAAVAAYRALGGRRSTPLPGDVFELLGEASLGGQHSVRVVRFGPRTLLVAVSASGARTLAELTDPQATERIVAACHGGSPRPAGRMRRPSPEAAAEAGS